MYRIAVSLQEYPHTPAATEMDRASRRILHESGLQAGHFEAAHAALYIHLLRSVQLAQILHTDAVAHGPSDRAFGYGLRLILAGLRSEIGGPHHDRCADRPCRAGDLSVAIS